MRLQKNGNFVKCAISSRLLAYFVNFGDRTSLRRNGLNRKTRALKQKKRQESQNAPGIMFSISKLLLKRKNLKTFHG